MVPHVEERPGQRQAPPGNGVGGPGDYRGADSRQEVLYVDPHTPRGDACVKVDGYDIKILPASSVMQAAVYWSLIAESAPPAAPTRRGALIATSRTPGE